MRNLPRAIRMLAVWALGLSLLLSACGDGDDATSDTTTAGSSDTTAGSSDTTTSSEDLESDGTLVIAGILEFISADPPRTVSTTEAQFLVQWSETLVKQVGDDFELVPLLAESFEQLDDVTYQFNLRKGVKFHNGEELKASDVVFSLKRAIERPEAASAVKDIDPDGFEILDDYTLTIKSKTPVATFLGNLSQPRTAIVSEVAVTAIGEEAFGADVTGAGTGPFQWKEWVPGVGATLTRFDDYWGEKAHFDTLDWRFVPDANSRSVMLETGEADVMYGVSKTQYDTLASSPDIDVYAYSTGSVRALFFGEEEGQPFADVRLRQAVSYAIDRAALVENVFGQFAEPAESYLVPGILGSNPDFKGYPYDPDRAVELLAEAGYGPDEFEVTLTFFNQDDLVRIGQIMQADLAAVGMKVNLNPMEATAWVAAQSESPGIAFGFFGSSPTTGDPNDLLDRRFHSDNIPEPNAGHVNSPELDALLDAGISTVDPDERQPIYEEIIQVIHDEAHALAFSWEKRLLATRADLDGIVVDAVDRTRYNVVSRSDG